MKKHLTLGLLVAFTTGAAMSRAEPQVEIRTHVVGRVTTPDGKPIAGATVWWQGPTPAFVHANDDFAVFPNELNVEKFSIVFCFCKLIARI